MNRASGWIKSSRSVNSQNCIEVATELDQLRDSKDPQGPTLKADIAAFVRAVKAGRFDR